MAQSLSIHERLLMRTLTAFLLGSSLSSIYVNVFIWQQVQSFRPVIIFNFSQFSFLLLVMFLSGYWLRKYSARSLIKGGLVISVMYYVLLVLLQERALNWLLYLGMLNGIGLGLFWSGFNLHQYVQTNSEGREYYFGLQQSWNQVAAVGGPLIGGLIIWMYSYLFESRFGGYYLVFMLSVSCFAFAFSSAWGFERLSALEFKMSHILRALRGNRPFQMTIAQQALLGIHDASVSTLMGIIGFVLLRGELPLGLYKFGFGALMAILGFVAGKRMTVVNRLTYAGVGAIAQFLAMIIFVLFMSLPVLFLFGLGMSFGVFLSINVSTQYFKSIDLDPKNWQHKYGYFTARDSVLGGARVLSYLVIFLLFIYFDEMYVARVWLVFAAILNIVVWLLMWWFERIIVEKISIYKNI